MPRGVDVVSGVQDVARYWHSVQPDVGRCNERPDLEQCGPLRTHRPIVRPAGPAGDIARSQERRPVEEAVVGGDPHGAVSLWGGQLLQHGIGDADWCIDEGPVHRVAECVGG